MTGALDMPQKVKRIILFKPVEQNIVLSFVNLLQYGWLSKHLISHEGAKRL